MFFSNITKRLSSRSLAGSLALLVIVATLILGSFEPVYAAIEYRSASSGDNGSGSSELIIQTPAGVTAGDVLIASVGKRQLGTGITPPAGWTLVLDTTTNADVQQATFYTVLTSTPATSYTFLLGGTTRGTGGIVAYSGVDTNNPIDASAARVNASGSIVAPSVTTTQSNSMVLASYSQADSTSFTQGSGMTKRYDVTSSGGGKPDTKIASAGQDSLQVAAGASGTKTITSTSSLASVGHTIALRPAPPSSITQSSHRWFNNMDTSHFSTAITNPTTGSDALYASIQDTTHFYTTGYYATGGNDWRIEKRKLTDGALVSGFGSGGVQVSAVSANDDRAWGIDQDSTALYVAGDDASLSNTNRQWRIEKRDKTTGALVPGFGTGGSVQSNPTPGDDGAREIKVDGSFIYAVGFDSTGANAWRIEKRDKTTGALVPGFGTGGVIVVDYSTANDEIAALVIDNDNLYVGGFDRNTGGTNSQIRIEKRDKTTGALVPGFGTGGVITENPFTGNAGSTSEDAIVFKGLLLHGGSLYTAATEGVTGSTDFQWRIAKRDPVTGAPNPNFGTGGVVKSNPSTAIDNPTVIRTDGTHLFVGGYDRLLDGGMSQWRIEKRDMTTGALVPGFGTGGVSQSNPSTGHDEIRDINVYGSNVIGVGYDLSPGNYQMRMEKRNILTGEGPADDSQPRAAQGAPVTSVALNEQVRLRMLLRVATSSLTAADQQFKLQFAERSGTCDTGFVGEAYADVTATSAIAWWSNSTLTDGSAAFMNVNDPTDGSNPVARQTYEQLNNFANNVSIIPVGSNGLWDMSLYNRSAPNNKSYCFRAVSSTNTVLASYASIPELSTPVEYSLEQGNYRWLQNTDSTSPGAGMALQNTATSVATGAPYRLRQILRQSLGTTNAATGFKLQAGEKISTCSAASFSDVAVPIGFHDNATPIDDAAITSTVNDPTPVSGSVVHQTYNENGAFTNPSSLVAGTNGLWDFSLSSNANAAGKTYCFRVTRTDGSQLSAYNQYPEMSFTNAGPTLEQQMRGGQSVVNGIKTPLTY